MNKKYKFFWLFLLAIAIWLTVLLCIQAEGSVLLNPKGLIGHKERSILITTTLLMLIVVIPTLILSVYISWKYRASNTKAKYNPDWNNSWLAEAVWWGVPCIIVFFLSVITWQSCFELHPFKPLDSTVKPIRIQAVALQWKWLFIYPDYGIASQNFVMFPEQTPLNFEVTADAPMNSFWIPQLGGQIYAMPGMKTQVHLIADEPGTYRGSSANLSGTGFADMNFQAYSLTKEKFAAWVESVNTSASLLDQKAYDTLAEPSVAGKSASYRLAHDDLFDTIIMKYMMPAETKMMSK